MIAETSLKLDAAVEVVRPSANVALLLGPSPSRPVRLTGISSALVDLLAAGCTRRDLCEHLKRQNFADREIERSIDGFLAKLDAVGVLGTPCGSNPAPRRPLVGDHILANVDGVARVLAVPFRKAPVVAGITLAVLLGMSISQCAAALFEGALWFVPVDLRLAGLAGLAMVPLWMLLHEMAHAIACRAVGYRVSGLGARIRKYRLPSLFIDARHLHAGAGKFAKAAVAFAGPVLDILFLGALSALVARTSPEVAGVSRVAWWAVCYGALCNWNPLRVSDGSNGLAALFEDARLVGHALSRSPQEWRHWIYRVWIVLYLGGYLAWIYLLVTQVRSLA